MRKTKQIAIILPDTLQAAGLQSLLSDYFHPVEISSFPSFDSFTTEGKDSFDYYFLTAGCFVLNTDYFMPRRPKAIIVLNQEHPSCQSPGYNCLNASDTQEAIIDQLQHLFDADEKLSPPEKNKDLSARETDVLKLIVKGHTNKDIADELSISLNTVLTHRKNITAKLGIKTVSGLTYYAIMNGLAPADRIG